MYLLSLEWFKYAECFVGVLACNGFDVAKYIYICMYVCMYVCVFFILAKRKQIRKLLWTRFFVQIGECPLLPLKTKMLYLVWCRHFFFVLFSLMLCCCLVHCRFCFWCLASVCCANSVFAICTVHNDKNCSPHLINKLNTSSISIKHYGFRYNLRLPKGHNILQPDFWQRNPNLTFQILESDKLSFLFLSQNLSMHEFIN